MLLEIVYTYILKLFLKFKNSFILHIWIRYNIDCVIQSQSKLTKGYRRTTLKFIHTNKAFVDTVLLLGGTRTDPYIAAHKIHKSFPVTVLC